MSLTKQCRGFVWFDYFFLCHRRQNNAEVAKIKEQIQAIMAKAKEA
jgi:hypothetical protein